MIGHTPPESLRIVSDLPDDSDTEGSTGSSSDDSFSPASEIRGSPPPILPEAPDAFSETRPQLAEQFSRKAYILADAADRQEPLIGQQIDLSGEKYTIDNVVNFGHLGGSAGKALGLGGAGAYAFLLKPEDPDKPAIVLYHGVRDGSSTLLATDPRGIGRAVLTAGGEDLNPQIAAWMKKNGQNGVLAVGHSMGGTMAALTAIYAPQGVKTRARTFAAPGVHKAAYHTATLS